MPEISDIGSVRTVIECALQKGVVDVVLSPGSRNAPFILSFNAIDEFQCISVVDERTAAFMALGMSQQSGSRTILSCTSGSAMMNYAPAIAEAYYQRVPLIVITADRPKEWIDQGEGQSMRQTEILKDVLCGSYTLIKERSEDDAWYNRRLINEAFENARIENRPVQINVPLSEPLYDTSPWSLNEAEKGFDIIAGDRSVTDRNDLKQIWTGSKRIMILVSQHSEDKKLLDQLKALNDDPRVAVVTETTANLYHFGFVCCIDRTLEGFIGSEKEADFVPDLLITIGENLISKKLKAMLRKHRTAIHNHWHFGVEVLDTFQSLTHLINAAPSDVLRSMRSISVEIISDFGAKWKGQFFKAEQKHNDFLSHVEYSDLSVLATMLDFVPDGWQIQMGNSSVVRYVQLFNQLSGVKYSGNRGVSGIEGCTSTAVGAALKTDDPVLIISGDHAFRYDANGLSFEELPKNLRVVVINNEGGNIFRIIDGPQNHEASDHFIEHAQMKSVKGLVEYHGVVYQSASTIQELESEMERLVSEDSGCRVLEVFTPRVESPEVLKRYFEMLRSN